MDVIPNRNQNWYLHTSKIQFLLPVSFTIEYKVGIVEFYLYMAFGGDLLKNGHQSLKTAEIGIRTPLKSVNYFRFVSQTTRVSFDTLGSLLVYKS